jgi:cobalt-zinc-cadmium efflux system protein
VNRDRHLHIPARRVLLAFGITLAAAAIEYLGARRSGSLFLVADAAHLVAHLGIFLVLLIPTKARHDRAEDFTTNVVLVLVLLIAIGIAWDALKALASGSREPPVPSSMLLSLLGLGANLTTAFLFKDPAEEHWSFRAALAHELSDAAMTVGGLVGALAIELFNLRWVDPGLSLGIAMWLTLWSLRLFWRRIRLGRVAWTEMRRH